MAGPCGRGCDGRRLNLDWWQRNLEMTWADVHLWPPTEHYRTGQETAKQKAGRIRFVIDWRLEGAKD